MINRMEKSIFGSNTRIGEILQQLSVVPWFKGYIEQIPPEFISMFIESPESAVDVDVINETVVRVTLNNPGGRRLEKWQYYLAEPYPGIRLLSGNMTGLIRLDGIGMGYKDTKTSVIHYCAKGRCEIVTKDGTYAYMEPRVLCVESHKHKEKNMDFHGEEYEGVEIAFDLDAFDDERVSYLKSLGIDIEMMRDNYARDAEYYIGNVSDKLKAAEMELDSIMKSENPDTLTLFLMALRINNLVNTGEVTSLDSRFYLTQGQKSITEEIHNLLISDIRHDITMEQLTDRFRISSVSLNKYFKIAYGDTVNKYIHKYRMRTASGMLIETDDSVADVAAAVGYDNQGKFSSAFKKIYNMGPLEYRRRNRAG